MIPKKNKLTVIFFPNKLAIELVENINKIIIKINSKSPSWMKEYVKIDHGFDKKSASKEK